MRPIIFLDIDDVIAIDPSFTGITIHDALQNEWATISRCFWQQFFAEAIENLVLLHQRFFCQYVISSSWSNYLSQHQIEYAFEQAGLDFIASNLHRHWRTPKSESPGRVSEIQNWISKYSHREQPILIIDDQDSGWNLINSIFDNNKQLLTCEPKVGFVSAKLETAIQLLAKQVDRNS
jgi:hypothetical protein